MNAAQIRLFTYRAGLLAKLGHDLAFTLAGAPLELEAARIRARFQLNSLRVQGAIRHGCLDANALDAKDAREIERVASEILQSRAHPEATLAAHVAAQTGGRFQVLGDLTLCGQTRPIEFEVLPTADGGLSASIELTPSRWGIAPHRAFGGALKLQDRVGVQVALTLEPASLVDESWRTARIVWANP